MKLKTEIGNFGRIIRPSRVLEDLDISKTQSELIAELTQVIESENAQLVNLPNKKPKLPNNISALFVGSSEGGRTMAAEAMAHRLDWPLLRIDLSMVVSKYIGETEKNLNRVFDAASQLGAVLLLDEADALFGKRSDVKDSHDRFANLETGYLLERMERHQGLVILSSNSNDNMDEAFLRRFRLTIKFDPATEIRKKLKHNMKADRSRKRK